MPTLFIFQAFRIYPQTPHKVGHSFDLDSLLYLSFSKILTQGEPKCFHDKK